MKEFQDGKARPQVSITNLFNSNTRQRKKGKKIIGRPKVARLLNQLSHLLIRSIIALRPLFQAKLSRIFHQANSVLLLLKAQAQKSRKNSYVNKLNKLRSKKKSNPKKSLQQKCSQTLKASTLKQIKSWRWTISHREQNLPHKNRNQIPLSKIPHLSFLSSITQSTANQILEISQKLVFQRPKSNNLQSLLMNQGSGRSYWVIFSKWRE